MTLPAGTRIADRFTVLREVGKGGMGVIYEVTDARFRATRRALKMLQPGREGDATLRARFVEEVVAAAKIKSEHVVQVIDYDTTAASPWLLMELLEGETLDAYVTREGPLPLEEARRRVVELGHALGAAHAAGVLHLDLKPANLFLARTADAYGTTKLKVLDFGLSRQIMDGRTHVVQSRAVGTEAWMPPEQFNKKAELRPSADVWPLGLVAFWMLTAKHYWLSVDERGDVDDAMVLMGEIARGAEVLASSRAQERGSTRTLPEGFDAWFGRCVALDAKARWDDGGVASRALDEVLTRASAVASVPPTPVPQVPPTRSVTEEVSRPGVPAGFTAPVRVVLPPVVAPVAKPAVAKPATTEPVVAKPATTEPVRVSGDVKRLVVGVVMAGFVGLGVWDLTHRDPTAETTEETCPADMVLIHGGTFLMGSPDGEGESDEHPRHAVTLPSYCIDRVETSVSAYRACVQGQGCSEPEGIAWNRNCNWGARGREDHPVNCLNWSQARAYCMWSGHAGGPRRLLREAEWEFGARGAGDRRYPWGPEEPDGTRANLCGSECLFPYADFAWSDVFATTAPVSSLTRGATPGGVLNLAGNVREWVEDVYASDAYAHHDETGFYGRGATDASQGTEARVLRGGCWNSDRASFARSADRDWVGSSYSPTDVGIRCARSVVMQPANP